MDLDLPNITVCLRRTLHFSNQGTADDHGVGRGGNDSGTVGVLNAKTHRHWQGGLAPDQCDALGDRLGVQLTGPGHAFDCHAVNKPASSINNRLDTRLRRRR